MVTACAVTVAAAAPTITTAGPNQVDAGGPAFTLMVFGDGFVQGSTVNWSGTPLATSFVGGTQLAATVPAALSAVSGRFNITVTNPGGEVSSPWGQMYIQPVLTSISPTSATQGDSNVRIIATGVGFTDTDSIRINVSGPQWDLLASNFNSTSLMGSIPAAALVTAGTALVSIVDRTSGASSRTLPFTIGAAPRPTITSLNPNSASVGSAGFTMTITGVAFVSGATVQWNGTPLTTTFLGSTQLTAVVPASSIANVGSASVTVANPSGAVSGAATFWIVAPAPTVTGCSPGGATAGGPAFTLTVQGTGFLSGASVLWKNNSSLVTTFVSSTQLTAAVPASLIASAGMATFQVVNPGSFSVSYPAASFFVTDPPVVTSLVPSTITVGGPAFRLSVLGAGLVSGSTVQWNGSPLTTVFVTPALLTATVPAALIATTGTAAVTVVNPWGTVSGPATFTITAAVPVITGCGSSTGTITAGGPDFTLRVLGTGFDSGAVAQWNGSPLTTSFVSTTSLTATVPASLIAAAGTASVTVVNPGGAVSNAVTVTISSLIPMISSLLPASATAGGPDFNLTVTGAGYLSGATVQWNGSALATTFVSPTQLTATVPASLIATIGLGAIRVVNPGGYSCDAVMFTITATAPTMTGWSPSGATAGGPAFTLTVQGTGFVSGAIVTWNGSPLVTTFVSATQLTAAVPASWIATAGVRVLKVVNPSGAASNSLPFTITALPAIASLNPSTIMAGSLAFTLTVQGSAFVSGSMVQWNGAALTTTFVSFTQLTATVPASLIAATGPAAVTVVNPGGYLSGPATFTIGSAVAPTVTACAPGGASAGGPAFTLAVVGTGFVSGASVLWNGSTLVTTFVSAAQLNATVPASLIASVGVASVKVVNPGGAASDPVSFAITSLPSITSLAPGRVAAGSPAFTLTVYGTNFVSGSAVRWNASLLTTTFVSATELTANVPASLIVNMGPVSVAVVNPGGAVSEWPATFTITASAPVPRMTGCSPCGATAGGPAFALTVQGTDFVSGAAVVWNGSPLVTTFVSATQLTAAVPASLIANAGVASVKVVNPGGAASDAVSFIITALPVITSLAPSTIAAGSQAFTLTIQGSAFVSGSAARWNGLALATEFVSATQLTATVPVGLIAATGTASITVVNPGGYLSGPATFTITTSATAPTLTGCSPGGVTAGGPAFTFTVQGTGFVSGAVVVWSGSPLVTTFVSSTQLTALVPAVLIATAGVASYKVVNPGGAASDPASFFITALPAITSLTPSGTTAGGAAFTLTVQGSAFVSGSAVQWNGSALTTVLVSSTQLTATVSASLIATTGSATITVVNPGGYLSGPATFTIGGAVPSITAYTPATVTVGGPGFTLNVFGTGFDSGAVVQWNGSPLTTTSVSATQLTASAPASLIVTTGTARVAVVNPGGAASTAVTVTISPATPTITSLLPPSAAAGGPSFGLAVVGAGYLSGATVQWNGSALATTFLSPAQLNATVPANLIATPGTANITVVNPGGAISATAALTIVAAVPTITQLSPRSATAGGPGFTLNVIGAGYLPGAAVQWNGSALATDYANATQLYATVPASLIASPGTATITVVSGGATSSGYSFSMAGITPTITTAAPNQVDAGGPDFTVTVTGSGFVQGSTVTWSGTVLESYFVSSTQINARVPAGLYAVSGRFNLTVANPGGVVSNSWGQMYIQPVLISISPTSAAAGSSTVTIIATGTGFTSTDAIRINVSGPQWDLLATYISQSSLRAIIPAAALAAAGPALVSIVDTANGSFSHTLPFTISAAPTNPTITSLNPPWLTAGSPSFTLNITGTGFASGAVAQWNGTPLQTAFTSATQLSAMVFAGLVDLGGTANITVINLGGAVSNVAPFTIILLSSLSPGSATAGGPAFTLTVNGGGFNGGTKVLWNGTELPTTFVNSSQVTALVAASLIASPGSALVQLKMPPGGLPPMTTFPIVSSGPSISGLSPVSTTAGGAGFNLTVNGSGFASGATVQWNGSALATTFVSATQLIAAVPASLIAPAGSAAVTVANPSGPASFAVTFTIAAAATTPTITGLSPCPATAQGGTFTMTVTGTGFQPGAIVHWDRVLLATAYVSSTQLDAVVPASLIGSAGGGLITVTNPTGPVSNEAVFPVIPPNPYLSGFSPPSATAGGPAFTLTVNGSGYLSGATVQWNGTSLATTFVNPTQLTTAVPSALISSPGSASIRVTNPGGTIFAAATFAINAPIPVISGFSPDWMAAGAPAFTLTVKGRGYLSGSTVQWNGSPLATTYVSPTQLTAQVTADLFTSPGTAEITVVNSDGGVSNSLSYTVLGLTVLSADPPVATAGSAAFTFTVHGRAFLSGASVYWNGSPLATAYVDQTALTASVPASLIAAAGTVTIAVANPGGLLSNTISLLIQSAAPSPSVSAAGIVNAASSLPSIAPGSLISIYGTNLAQQIGYAGSTPLPAAINSTSVLVGNTPVPLLFVSPNQINAQVPYETPVGPATLVVRANGAASSPMTFAVQATAPGVLTTPLTQHALVQNAADWALNSGQNPAAPGQYVIVYVTGQGLVDNPVATGAAAPSTPLSRPLASVQSTIGGQTTPVSFAGLAPGMVGVLQVNLQVPAVAAGERMLELTIGGVAANSTLISVGAN